MTGETRIDEVGDGIFRISTYLFDFVTFNQYLVRAEEPLLFHCGMRAIFPQVSKAAATVLPIEDLRWIAFGHFEADESGAVNEWLESAPGAQVAHGAMGCITSLNDQCIREPRMLDDGEVIDIGGHRMRHIDTPHVPHAWDARVLFDETTRTLFSGDLFSQAGDDDPVRTGDIVGPAIEYEHRLPFSSLGPATVPTIRRLAALEPTTVCLMHGSVFTGDGAAMLNGLADFYETHIAAVASAQG